MPAQWTFHHWWRSGTECKSRERRGADLVGEYWQSGASSIIDDRALLAMTRFGPERVKYVDAGGYSLDQAMVVAS